MPVDAECKARLDKVENMETQPNELHKLRMEEARFRIYNLQR